MLSSKLQSIFIELDLRQVEVGKGGAAESDEVVQVDCFFSTINEASRPAT
jgi:hypothetical protein